MVELELIDTKALLNDLEVEYTEHGKNVTRGWINIACPFCGDHSNHCGINLRSGMFNCWICNEKGSIVKLVKEIKETSFLKAETIVNAYLQESSLDAIRQNNTVSANSVSRERLSLLYPTSIQENMPEPHRNYLLSRNFDPELLVKKYSLKFTYNTGDYRFKIIAPVFFRGQEVSWIAMDIVRDGSIPPYIKCPSGMTVLPANDCLYNIDSVKSKAILVEGITDVWRIGDGCIASMTKSLNSRQIDQLTEYGVKKVFVMYDSDAIKNAKLAANKLSGFFSVEVVELSEGDPADLTPSEAKDLKESLLN